MSTDKPPEEEIARPRRYEDMSPEGYIEVLQEEDGDVILVVYGNEPLDINEYVYTSVQFCTFGGGGRSANVRKALLALRDAIVADNTESPQYRGRKGKRDEAGKAEYQARVCR